VEKNIVVFTLCLLLVVGIFFCGYLYSNSRAEAEYNKQLNEYKAKYDELAGKYNVATGTITAIAREQQEIIVGQRDAIDKLGITADDIRRDAIDIRARADSILATLNDLQKAE